MVIIKLMIKLLSAANSLLTFNNETMNTFNDLDIKISERILLLFSCVRSDLIWPFLTYLAYHRVPQRSAPIGFIGRATPSQARPTQVSHLDGVFYLPLHRHKIQ
jgi:hypothetical protein